jgi:hypothetical protein
LSVFKEKAVFKEKVGRREDGGGSSQSASKHSHQ